MAASFRSAEVIVVGLGALGAACLYQLARAGVPALGVDRFAPPHDRGSSHGETRITRRALGEGADYAPLAARSHEIWRELEAATGETLMLACGVLNLGPPDSRARMHGVADFVGEAARVAALHDVPHELVDAGEIRRRWPAMTPREDERGCFEPGGGVVFPERCIAAQLYEAQRLGALALLDETVLAIEPQGSGVCVRTSRGELGAARAIVAAGAWLPGLAGGWTRRLELRPQAVHWFAPSDPSQFTPDRFPVFIWLHGEGAEGGFYGFPIVPGAPTRAVKLATEHARSIGSPDGLDHAAAAQSGAGVWRDHVEGRIGGLRAGPVKSIACLYTVSPDSDFAIGPMQDAPQITLASACSGHGFKHSAALGERLARQAAGEAVEMPAAFDPGRFAALRPRA
ncbi:MAG TPA: N-methyl-L-tryptophan oxidase [Caulobacteraceae bacterium]|jgi:sarcosine oxidase|nr:N-methyl-L-tryptophan oxidase [Caulobacteraceae bacterium]